MDPRVTVNHTIGSLLVHAEALREAAAGHAASHLAREALMRMADVYQNAHDVMIMTHNDNSVIEQNATLDFDVSMYADVETLEQMVGKVKWENASREMVWWTVQAYRGDKIIYSYKSNSYYSFVMDLKKEGMLLPGMATFAKYCKTGEYFCVFPKDKHYDSLIFALLREKEVIDEHYKPRRNS